MIEENFCTEAQVAGELGLKISTMRNWAAKRLGPPRIRVGRKIFYRREALVAWMQSQEKVVAAPAPRRARSARGRR
jgi:hypothetical protein